MMFELKDEIKVVDLYFLDKVVNILIIKLHIEIWDCELNIFVGCDVILDRKLFNWLG